MTRAHTTRYVAGLAFDKAGHNLALIKKERPLWQKGCLNAIGGKILHDEAIEDAMRREFREETGVDITGWVPFVRLVGERIEESWVVYFFVTFTDLVREVRTTTDEKVELYDVSTIRRFASVAERNDLITNLFWLVPMALHKPVMNGLWHTIRDTAGH